MYEEPETFLKLKTGVPKNGEPNKSLGGLISCIKELDLVTVKLGGVCKVLCKIKAIEQ